MTLGVVVLGFSWLQVRAGRWSHIDASVRNERNSLNVFLGVLSSQRGAAMVSDAATIHVARVGIAGSAYCHSAANC